MRYTQNPATVHPRLALLNNRGFKTLVCLLSYFTYAWSAASCEDVILTPPFCHKAQRFPLKSHFLCGSCDGIPFRWAPLCTSWSGGYCAHSRGPTSLRHLPPATYPRQQM